MKIASGYNRIVLLIGLLAIKFPNPCSQRQFILGMACNLKEYELHRESNNDPRLMRVYSIGYLALWLICKRYDVIERALSEEELATIPITELDRKIGNYGYDGGRIVVLDYGHSGCWYTG